MGIRFLLFKSQCHWIFIRFKMRNTKKEKTNRNNNKLQSIHFILTLLILLLPTLSQQVHHWESVWKIDGPERIYVSRVNIFILLCYFVFYFSQQTFHVFPSFLFVFLSLSSALFLFDESLGTKLKYWNFKCIQQ